MNWIVFVFFTALAGVYIFMAWKKDRKNKFSGDNALKLVPLTLPQLTKLQRAVQAAVNKASRDFGIVLSFGKDSLEQMDEILSKIASGKKLGSNDVVSEEEILRWGSYVGEVVLRETKGEWCCNSSLKGLDGYVVRFNGTTISPFHWVSALLYGDGDEVNLVGKYNFFVLKNHPKFWDLEMITSLTLENEKDYDQLTILMTRLKEAGVVPQVDILMADDQFQSNFANINVRVEQAELARKILSGLKNN